MNRILILLAIIGCCSAAPKRRVKSYGSTYTDHVTHDVDSTVGQSVVHHEAVNVQPVVAEERRGDFYEAPVPSYPEFGVKVDPMPGQSKVVRSRARAVLGRGFNHNFNYVQRPTDFAEVEFHQPVASAKVLVPPYQQKPLYQANRYRPSYHQTFNKYYDQQRTDDVAQPLPAEVSGPAVFPSGIQSPSESDDRATPKPVAILAMNQDVNYDGTFVYDFEAENGIKSAVSGSTKRVEGFEKPVQVMSGSYSYTSPEGEPVETRWFADETGFHAEGSHLPVAPPVPDAIQRAIEYIKTQPPQQQEDVAYQPLPLNPDVQVSPQRFDQSQQYNRYPSYQTKYENAPHYRGNYKYQQPYESYPSHQ